ncbi:MAG: hypothetical protein N2578_05245 [Bdellovibrionaceae bacterium]|nr:hypothetical protein [Pseudobdellovibrionaceae bacterium]
MMEQEKNNVIELPTNRRVLRKQYNQKAVLVLSIFSVLMLSSIVNRYFFSPSTLRPSLSREVASVDMSSHQNEVEFLWERQVAEEIATRDIAGKIAEPPTPRDELVFGVLKGRYGVELENGKVRALKVIDPAKTVEIPDPRKMIKNYRELFSVEFADASAPIKVEKGYMIRLLAKDKTIVGNAVVDLDPQGAVQSLSFEK